MPASSDALGFGELAIGGLLLTMGITGTTPRQVIAGQAKHVKPIAATGGGGRAPASYVTAGGSTIVAPHGSATNPLPGWHRSRIDQGVDFYGGSKIVAPEGGKVLATGAPGWPEGGGVLLQLAGGKIVYFYEGLRALVKPGQVVSAGQQIASGIPGGSIEVGLADANGVPLSHGEYVEGMVTKAGRAAARWLNWLGAPQ